MARVDGTAYNLFGMPVSTPNSLSGEVTDASFTSTHSIFVLNAGTASITLDFFSPVSFHNYTRQSMPFSYLTVSSIGLNGANPAVQIYSDIDDTWTGQSNSTSYSFATSGTASVHQLQANHDLLYTESEHQQALWGKAVFAGSSNVPGKLVAASGARDDLRNQFRVNGSLTGETSTFVTGDVVSFWYELGLVADQPSCTFAIGYVRPAAVNHTGQAYTPYYRAYFPTINDAISRFLDDYPAALAESHILDNTVQSTGATVGGQNYADVLALSVRQTFGGIDLTIPNNTLNTDEAVAFIKEISSDGNIQTMDIILELLPFFYTFNPEYIRLLLDPVVSYLSSGRWRHPWVIHDLGERYPNATGHPLGHDEEQPVEETGNLLILAAAYQASSGNKTWASSHKTLFDKYATWLVNNGLYPSHQLSTNDGLGPFTNMTQLGVKAAIALSAYGQLTGDASWTKIGNSFASTILEPGVGVEISHATNQNYFTLTYGNDTWFMMFNLYPAKLLNLTCFPESAYTGQSAFLPTVRGPYGVPLDGTVPWGKTDWQMWAAAVSEPATRSQMIDDLHAYASNGKNDLPFPDRYFVQGSEAGLITRRNFRARPVVGAHFAVWTLMRPWQVVI